MDCICTAPPLWIPSRHIRSSITGLPTYFAAGCQETESRLQIETIILSFKAVLKNRLQSVGPSSPPNLSPHPTLVYMTATALKRNKWTLMKMNILIKPWIWEHVKMVFSHYPLSTFFLVWPYLARNPINLLKPPSPSLYLCLIPYQIVYCLSPRTSTFV